MSDLGPIKFLTIHCAATPEGRAVTAEQISQWDIAKFGQVSYHHVVLLDGTIKDTLAIDKKGAHVKGANTGNIGVCYIGGVDKAGNPKDTRNAAQKAALKRLITHYVDKYPGIIVRGHRDWPNVKKACPSFDVADWITKGMLI
jgi:N-acetyl-anhydromuramyl-L-alanine amidase AmpD